jgi:hypothetical protein
MAIVVVNIISTDWILLIFVSNKRQGRPVFLFQYSRGAMMVGGSILPGRDGDGGIDNVEVHTTIHHAR